MSKVQNVFLIGAKSLGAYGGYETFVYKLTEYHQNKAHSMIEFDNYNDLFNKYESLEKISFDYAVVEKESSIQVMRYSGGWKDVGTWNMMAEVMADKTKGKAILDEVCENTNVINELNIPILCMGCKDMIIAASGDGILISDKSDVLKFMLEGNCSVVVRPSGTEPKLKTYISVSAVDRETAEKEEQIICDELAGKFM